ncbi:MAG: hypothetical protein MI754_06550 [Chromatiales bacterium]|nr:hypothetical protein [Chromatiales bacterium]
MIGGLTQRKNNHLKTAREGYVVDRVRPDKGYKHVITKKDIHDFTDLIPDWDDISIGIKSVILDAGSSAFDGLYRHFSYEGTGIIWLSAWPEALWTEFTDDYFSEHQWHFDRLGVVYEKRGDDWLCHFTKSQAKAFMLLHIFLHELGHHIDKLRSRKQNVMRGGETFAEQYANTMFTELWAAYVGKFDQP